MTSPNLPPQGNAAPPAAGALRGRVFRGLCIAGGGLCVGLGVLGMVLPVLPTTPFLLLAAALFFRGSPRLYAWLLHNRHFGRFIQDYRAGRGIPRRAQRLAIGLLWLTIGATVVMLDSALWVELALLAVAVGVTAYLARLPVRENSRLAAGEDGGA